MSIEALVNSGSFCSLQTPRVDTSNLFSAGKGTFETDTESWIAYGLNTIERDTTTSHSGSASLKITHVNHSGGAYLTFANATDLSTDLIVGKWYRIRGFAKMNTSNAFVLVDGKAGGSTDISAISSTDWQFFQLDFEAGHATDCILSLNSLSSGEIMWIDSLVIQERPEIPEKTKFVQCVTDGNFSFDQNHSAYGTWDFAIYKHLNADGLRVQFISDTPLVLPNFNGYYLEISNSAKLRLVEVTGAVETVLFASQYTYGEKVWWDFRITRELSGLFTIYSRNSSVRKNWHIAAPDPPTTNPVTDNTHTSSRYCVVTAEANGGILGYKHSLGVEQ